MRKAILSGDHQLKILIIPLVKQKFPAIFKVYGRNGLKCVRKNCKGTIRKVNISNRSTFFALLPKIKLTLIWRRYTTDKCKYKISNQKVRRVKKQTSVNRIRKSKYKSALKQMETLLKKEIRKIKEFFRIPINSNAGC